MKKIICLIALAVAFVGVPCFAAPGGHHGGGHGGYNGGGMRGPGGQGGRMPAIHGHVSHGNGPSGPSVGHRPPMHMGGAHRPPHNVAHHYRPLPPPPIYRPYRPFIRPYYPYYYSSVYPYYTPYSYYPATTYVYDPVLTTPVETTPVSTAVNGVVVTDPYVKVNTAANVINAAANVATMVRYWTW